MCRYVVKASRTGQTSGNYLVTGDVGDRIAAFARPNDAEDFRTFLTYRSNDDAALSWPERFRLMADRFEEDTATPR